MGKRATLKSFIKHTVQEMVPESKLQEKYLDPGDIHTMRIFSDTVDMEIIGKDSGQDTIDVSLITYKDGPEMSIISADGHCDIHVFSKERTTLPFISVRPGSKLKMVVPAGIIQKWFIDGGTGDIVFAANKTKTIHIKTGSGEVRADSLFLDTIRVETASGDAEITEVSGNIDCTTNSGDIDMVNLRSPSLSLSASSGDLEMKHLYVDKADMRTASGDIKGKHIHIGDLKMNASSGDIEFENFSGRAAGRASSGDVLFMMQENGSLDLSTSSGDIEVKLDNPELDIQLELNTLSGDITTNLDQQSDSTANLSDSTSEDFHLIKLYSTSGDIDVHG
ncbi:DUF4097 domain-containing protein [Virgibacillus halophilus]|uniref:DUF4097 family beta strand repeat-containing protein n=1 Tax=Tigheibacillus halophilus TaxID=361280 RepID=A0ABU5CBG8_9BACI|nr:DUF4097 family beta strand repeat-containing protein [Virgibacillus halophilus]